MSTDRSRTPRSRPDRAGRPARRRPSAAAAAVAAAVLVVLPAAAASAHVRVTPDTSPAGGYALLVFRVPTESDTASTTQVQVTLPTDTPLTYAAVQPVAGWTATVEQAALPAPVDVDGTTITQAPRTITWTAQARSGIAPGQFQQFPVLVGPLPAEGTTLLLPAVQTYSDGSVVAWDQPTTAGGEEPENPSPQVVTTAAEADDDAAAPASAAPSASAVDAGSTGSTGTGSSASASEATSTSGSLGTWLGGAGTALGAAALVVALGRRRPAGPGGATP